MIRVIIVEPNITKEENERNLKRVEEVLTKIVRKYWLVKEYILLYKNSFKK